MESTAATLTTYSDAPVTYHGAEMHVDNTYKYETIHDEEVIATKNKEFATTHAKYNSTHKKADAQYQLMSGQSTPRVLFGNKARPETMEKTKRGLEFLHISDNMPRQSGTIAVAKRPLTPDAPLKEKEGELKVRVTLYQEDRRDKDCVHTVDTPGSSHTYDMESAATTLANYIDVPENHHDAGTYADNTYKEETIYDEELIATNTLATNDEEFVAATLAVYNEEHVAVDTLATLAVATLAAHYYEELVAVDTLATNSEELAVATTLAATKKNCDKSKKIAVEVYRVEAEIEECNVEQQKADATALTGSQDTKNDVEVSAAKTTSTNNKFKKPL
jgi:hypothetical protein